MPQVRLYTQDDDGVTIPTPPGPGVYLPAWRVRMWVKVGGEYKQRQAVLDTGAPACVFSKQVWADFHARRLIEWVCHPPAAGPPPANPTVTIGGGTYRFRLGRVVLQPVDLDGGELPPVRVLVKCVEDEPAGRKPGPSLFLIGLGGILNGRTLTLSASADGTRWAGHIAE